MEAERTLVSSGGMVGGLTGLAGAAESCERKRRAGMRPHPKQRGQWWMIHAEGGAILSLVTSVPSFVWGMAMCGPRRVPISQTDLLTANNAISRTSRYSRAVGSRSPLPDQCLTPQRHNPENADPLPQSCFKTSQAHHSSHSRMVWRAPRHPFVHSCTLSLYSREKKHYSIFGRGTRNGPPHHVRQLPLAAAPLVARHFIICSTP